MVTGGRRGLGAALVDEVLARGARKVCATVTVKAALSGPVERLVFSTAR